MRLWQNITQICNTHITQQPNQAYSLKYNTIITIFLCIISNISQPKVLKYYFFSYHGLARFLGEHIFHCSSNKKEFYPSKKQFDQEKNECKF